ncbi:hypothetical protein ACIGNX_18615 [Actinosynnema sp. NPDC053489]|uniref:hypothetical protein n=1 Tax=Actinosynnema sp. NPDC053489 TaxID=3363916 RepID=UPI0037CA2CEB
MPSNTAGDRDKIASQRNTIATHIEKWRRYPNPQDKEFALKTIRNAQAQIQKLKSRHPSLRHDTASEDTWQPPRG